MWVPAFGGKSKLARRAPAFNDGSNRVRFFHLLPLVANEERPHRGICPNKRISSRKPDSQPAPWRAQAPASVRSVMGGHALSAALGPREKTASDGCQLPSNEPVPPKTRCNLSNMLDCGNRSAAHSADGSAWLESC